MLIKKTGTVTTLLFFIGCAGAPKPPNCNNSDYAKRVNPDWVSEVADYSVPWDNDKDQRKEKLDTIKSIKKRSSPFRKEQKPTESPSLTDTPANIINKMAWPTTAGTIKKNPILIQPQSTKNPASSSQKKAFKKTKNKKGAILPPKGPSSAERKALEERMKQKNKQQSMPLPKKKSPPSYLTPAKGPEERPQMIVDIPFPPVDLIQPKELDKNVKTFVLHVGSYKNINNALKQQKSLFKAGFPVYIRSTNINKTPYHRVFLGPDLLRKQAEAFKEELAPRMNIKIYSSKNLFAK